MELNWRGYNYCNNFLAAVLICVCVAGCSQSQPEPPPKPVPLGSKTNAELAAENGPKWEQFTKHLKAIASSLPAAGKVGNKPVTKELSPIPINVWSQKLSLPNRGPAKDDFPNTELMMFDNASDLLRSFELSSDPDDLSARWAVATNFYFALKDVKEAADQNAKAYKEQEDVLKVGLPKYVVIIRANKVDAKTWSAEDFQPGVVSFELAFADVDSEQILGTLTDKATNSEKVSAFGKEDQMGEESQKALNEDLIGNTRTKVIEDVKKLTGGKFDADSETITVDN